MPLTPVRFPMFSGVVLPAMILLAGCSSPKTAAVPAEKPGPATVEVAVRSDAGKAGVPSDPFVAAVRAGTMSGYSKATIGHAFESAFRDAHWSSRQLKGGTQMVTFTGILPANMRPECGAAKTGTAESPCAQTAKVTFEWTFASDGHLFHLSHADPDPWPESHRTTRDMLLFIYG